MLRREQTTVLPYMEEGNSDVAKSDRRYADESFAQFWAVYPRKVAKIAAKRKWDSLRPTPELVRQMMAALEWQIPTWTDHQFIPHPSTWLHNGRWEDEKPKPRTNGTVREIEPVHWASCPHKDKCGSAWECQGLKANGVLA